MLKHIIYCTESQLCRDTQLGRWLRVWVEDTCEDSIPPFFHAELRLARWKEEADFIFCFWSIHAEMLLASVLVLSQRKMHILFSVGSRSMPGVLRLL